MTRYWYDTEFIEDGKTIDLISIGIVAEDGREYYAVCDSIDHGDAYYRIRRHSWLLENVVRSLPLANFHRIDDSPSGALGSFDLDRASPAVKRRELIAQEVRDFLIGRNERVELWGYYSAYDHVVLAQLFGTMMNLPKGVPMWTNDLMQFAASIGLDDSTFPQQAGTAHNALDDARWTREAWKYLTAQQAVRA